MTNYAYIGTTPSLIEDLKTEEGRKIFNEACFEQYSDASRAVMFSIGKNNYHVSKQNIAVMQNKAAKPTNEGAKTYAILGGKPVAADPRDTTQAVTHPTPEEIILGGMAGELVEDEPEDKAEPYERRYRFKDAEIDALMHKLIPGFERMLDQVMDDAGGVHNEGYASLDPEGATINAIIFESHSVEFIGKTVDRNRWNRWPAVKPERRGEPLRVLYRLRRPVLDENGEVDYYGDDPDRIESVGTLRCDNGRWIIRGEKHDRDSWHEDDEFAELLFRPFMGPEESGEVNK